MRTRPVYTRIVTLVTLLALFALGGTSAFGARTCMHSDTAPAEQPQQHDHDAAQDDGSTPVPCQHEATGGMCASASLPAVSAMFSVANPADFVVRFVEATLPHSLDHAAVFHPPRF